VLARLMMLSRGVFASMPEQIDEHLTAYLTHYTSIGLTEVDSSRLSRLRRLADAVNRIIEKENGV
jgi:hypothetical protein